MTPTTTPTTEKEIRDAAVAIVREFLADCKWHTLEEIDPLMPDPLVEAFANLTPGLGAYSSLEYKLEGARLDLTGKAWWHLLETEPGYEPTRARRNRRVRRTPPLKGKRAAAAAARKAEIDRAYDLVMATFIDREGEPSMSARDCLAQAQAGDVARFVAVRRLLLLFESDDEVRRQRVIDFVVALEGEAVDPVCLNLFAPFGRGTPAYQMRLIHVLLRIVVYMDRETRDALDKMLFNLFCSPSRHADVRYESLDVSQALTAMRGQP